MPRTYITIEYFEYIELKGSVTVDELAAKFGLARTSAAVWLSNWAGRGYLTQSPPKSKLRIAGVMGRPRGGGYRIGPKWWGERVYGTSKENI